MNECLRLTDKNFKEEVLESKMPVFVDFWGSWCPPCKMIEPLINDLAQDLDGKVTVGKLNVDQNPRTRSMFEISAAPTFIVFKDGKVISRAIGAKSKNQLLEMIETALISTKEKVEIVTIDSPKRRILKTEDVFKKG